MTLLGQVFYLPSRLTVHHRGDREGYIRALLQCA
ncbi:MAG: hypothetical protein KatS3mg058_4495 [Roseiflexus sp.]|nr:MAG: hypothetical protein KatS3mg058_4495 [Roseiflexus sp.]